MHTALFQRLTHNETAPSWRALEPALGAFVRAAHTEDLPGLAALWRALPDLPARRGGYLLDLVAHVREVPDGGRALWRRVSRLGWKGRGHARLFMPGIPPDRARTSWRSVGGCPAGSCMSGSGR